MDRCCWVGLIIVLDAVDAAFSNNFLLIARDRGGVVL